MDDEIKKDIEEFLGFEQPRSTAHFIYVTIFIREQMGSILTSESTKDTDKYSNPVGRVVNIGPECYPPDRSPSGPRCKLLDWVVFKPNCGHLIVYRGTPMRLLNDDHIEMVIDDPTYVTRC